MRQRKIKQRKKKISNLESDRLARPKKRFGQNFLINPASSLKIIELASIEPSDTVVEIGPGRGAITRILAEKGCRVVALEVDRDLCKTLSEEFADFENVRIIETDALDFDFNSLGLDSANKMKVVANLPYNVATPILFKLLEFRNIIDCMVLMFQKEVATRIVASPGGKNYGALSIFPQLYSDISLSFKLPPGAFFPPPKVDSAVLFFKILAKPRFDVADEKLLSGLVRSAFSQRRKKLSNSLKSFFDNAENSDIIFSRAGIDPTRRAETISVEEFCLMSNVFTERMKSKV